jgi:hypothetical protein
LTTFSSQCDVVDSDAAADNRHQKGYDDDPGLRSEFAARDPKLLAATRSVHESLMFFTLGYHCLLLKSLV